MTGMERLLGFYNTAPPESMQAAIVRTILTNIDRVSDLTIYELSELCYTSPASLSRLVRKLGYKNFAYFQKDITDCVEKYDRHNRLVSPEAKPENKSMQSFFLDTLEELYNRFKEELDEEKTIELVNMIHEAEKVNLFSYSVYLMELFLQSDLFMQFDSDLQKILYTAGKHHGTERFGNICISSVLISLDKLLFCASGCEQ